MYRVLHIHKLPKTLWSDCGAGCSGKTERRALESEQSGSNVVYLMRFIALLMFTAAFKWCRFYLFLKKWKMKYFWNIVSVMANEWMAGLANDTCDPNHLHMLQGMWVLFSCTKLSQGSISFRFFSCVFKLEAISMYKAASCDLLYLLRFFGGNHAHVNNCFIVFTFTLFLDFEHRDLFFETVLYWSFQIFENIWFGGEKKYTLPLPNHFLVCFLKLILVLLTLLCLNVQYIHT